MFKVLFVDDEPYVIEGLHIMVDWEELGVEIVGEAGDGETALELIGSLRPDIVICDIQMPLLNGIELLEKCTRYKYRPKFIMLTGYGELHYVKSAMKYNAARYIMKPLDPDEICRSIREVCTELAAEYEKERENDEVIQYVMQETFSRILFGENKDSLYNRALFLLGLKEDSPLSLTITRLGEHASEETDAMREQLLPFIPASGFCIFFIGERILVSISAPESYGSVNDIARRMSKYGTGTQIIHVNSLYELADAYKLALEKFPALHDDIIISNTVRQSDAAAVPEDINDVLSLIMAGKPRQASDKVCSYIDSLRKSGKSLEYAYGAAVSLLMLMNRCAYVEGLNIESIFDEAVSALGNAYDFDTVKYLCVECIDLFSGSVAKVKTLGNLALSQSITDYIKNNYASNITITGISQIMHLNSAVIRKAIKAGTGMKFNDYLNYIRIQNAKHLIMHTNTKISQVSAEVGYNDYYYFTSKFKELTGMLPSDYRKNKKQ